MLSFLPSRQKVCNCALVGEDSFRPSLGVLTFRCLSSCGREAIKSSVIMLLLLLLIQTFSVLSLQLKNLRRHNKSVIDLSNANPACGHKDVPRSTGHIMVTTRYSKQQGSKSQQKVMRLYKQWHRPISKRFIKPPYSISRAASIDSDYCRLPTTSVLSNKADKLCSNQF